MKNTVLLSSIVLGIGFGALSGRATVPVKSVDTPNERAKKLAESVPGARKTWEKLNQEAKQVAQENLREDALKLLGTPGFQVLEKRASAESAIVAKLKAEGLLNSSELTIFPKRQPMAFIAAPGGPWNGHHAYPAGLVYHTLTNLKIGLGYAAAYRDIYGLKLNED